MSVNNSHVQFNKMEHFEVDNRHKTKLNSITSSILQKKTILVALVAFAAIAGISSAITGSVIVPVLCASVAMVAITLIAVAIMRSKQSNDLLKPEADLQIASKEKLEKTLPLLLLPKEALSNLCTFLPIKALGRLGCVNTKFSDFLGAETLNGHYTWKLIADKLRVSLEVPAVELPALLETTPKEQVKNLTLDFPEAKLDLLNKKLIMKVKMSSDSAGFFKEVFTKHVPEGYYLKHYHAFGSFCILYRDKNEIKALYTPGRMGKEQLTDVEGKLYSSIMSTTKSFEVVDA